MNGFLRHQRGVQAALLTALAEHYDATGVAAIETRENIELMARTVPRASEKDLFTIVLSEEMGGLKFRPKISTLARDKE